MDERDIAHVDTAEPTEGPDRISPSPRKADWIDFLRWFADSAAPQRVVDVVEKPWHFTESYAEYLREGGIERQ